MHAIMRRISIEESIHVLSSAHSLTLCQGRVFEIENLDLGKAIESADPANYCMIEKRDKAGEEFKKFFKTMSYI